MLIIYFLNLILGSVISIDGLISSFTQTTPAIDTGPNKHPLPVHQYLILICLFQNIVPFNLFKYYIYILKMVLSIRAHELLTQNSKNNSLQNDFKSLIPLNDIPDKKQVWHVKIC